jgi:hypothetical protein
MRIEKFAYRDNLMGWELEPTVFGDLNLLVGVSGVGKTKILKAIDTIKRVATTGQTPLANGSWWDISFQTNDNQHFQWVGEIEIADRPISLVGGPGSDISTHPKIKDEKLLLNGKEIFSRNAEAMNFGDKQFPRLEPARSAISLLSGEDEVALVIQSFRKLVFETGNRNRFAFTDWQQFDRLLSGEPDLDKIRTGDLDTKFKLALVSYRLPEVFQRIKARFIEIFPSVTDVRFTRIERGLLEIKSPEIQIQEKGIPNWIREIDISSGMYRTLLHLAELYLWPPGTVILIDEFENSLGVNCIDVLSEDMLVQPGLQFIITSHHPYVINAIGPKFWRVVRRVGGKVSTLDSTQLGLPKSYHQAFIQLINNEKFQEGIEPG